MYDKLLKIGISVFGGLPAFWERSHRLLEFLGYKGNNEIPHTVMFVIIYSMVSFIWKLPMSAYYTFKVEGKYGFNQQPLGFFIKNKIKEFFVILVLSLPVISGFVQIIIKAGGENFILFLWGFTALVVVFFMTSYARLIIPIFYEIWPLPDGRLKKQIEELAKKVDFPFSNIYVIEDLSNSTHLAYMFGIFSNARIYLNGALVKDFVQSGARKSLLTTGEVMAIVGHEIGHWKLHHLLKGYFIFEMNFLLLLYVYDYLYHYTPLYQAFGFHDNQPVIIGYILMNLVIAPYLQIFRIFLNMVVRRNEFQADEFACKLKLGKDLKTAHIKLSRDRFPIFDKLFSMWHHTHPSLLDRLRTIDAVTKKM